MVNRGRRCNHAALPAEVTQRLPLKLSCPQAPPAGGVVKTVKLAVWETQLIYPWLKSPDQTELTPATARPSWENARRRPWRGVPAKDR
jgi:hypothetical protein